MPPSLHSRDPEIDRILEEWASLQGLAVSTREHWDSVVKRIAIQDSGGDSYELYAGRNFDDAGREVADPARYAVVGAGLVKRGQAKHHAFRREREQFTFRREVGLHEIAGALGEARIHIGNWVTQAGNTLGK